MLQDYLVIQLSDAYGNQWKQKIDDECRSQITKALGGNPNKSVPDHLKRYRDILDITDKYGAKALRKEAFDVNFCVTMINTFQNVCMPANVKDWKSFNNEYFKEFVATKNHLFSHVADFDDWTLLSQAYTLCVKIKGFLQILEVLEWEKGNSKKQEFLSKYSKRIKALEASNTNGQLENESHAEEVPQVPVHAPAESSAFETRGDTGSSYNNYAEESFRAAFLELNIAQRRSDAMEKIDELSQKDHVPSMLFMAFNDRYGVFTEKNTQNADELLTSADMISDSSKWMITAATFMEKNDFASAVAYYIGVGMINDVPTKRQSAWRYVAKIFTSAVNCFDMFIAGLNAAQLSGDMQMKQAYDHYLEDPGDMKAQYRRLFD